MSKTLSAKETANSEVLSDEEFQKRLSKLTPEQADMFMRALELTIKKRRILLLGYVSTLIIAGLGSLIAMFVFVDRPEGSFRAWVFLLPFLGAGTCLYFFGRAARKATP